ncbi:hypothetical protein BJ875DRAFT_505990 [Amylocarpus encephaloides]|uniref:Uncharacterized protein n=1 Tax=Amylocarpus encephaloides TaxID=45428 RepID=A0A9P8C3E0_9HELO|nr:hypothetical protein BJ875DRAFT_505990 [Amylocarpus encephaloides]
MEEDDEEDGGLSLQRFSSASEQPPRMIADEGSDEGSDEEDEEDEAVSPTQMPTEMELRSITTGEADEELAGLYKTVKGCPCHGEHKSAPDITKAWEVPQKEGYQGKRLAIVEVAA